MATTVPAVYRDQHAQLEQHEAVFDRRALELAAPLSRAGLLDAPTVARLCATLSTQLAAHVAAGGQRTLVLVQGGMPPRPFVVASHAVRVRWSDWFNVLSPSGTPVTVELVSPPPSKPDPLKSIWELTPVPSLPLQTAPPPRASSPAGSVGSSSVSDGRASTAPTSACSSPDRHGDCPLPHRAGPDGAVLLDANGNPVQRRQRRQRGGVKQKQRGIHVDRSRIDVTAYDGGGTGVLTGGVMLGRRPRPATGLCAPAFLSASGAYAPNVAPAAAYASPPYSPLDLQPAVPAPFQPNFAPNNTTAQYSGQAHAHAHVLHAPPQHNPFQHDQHFVPAHQAHSTARYSNAPHFGAHAPAPRNPYAEPFQRNAHHSTLHTVYPVA